jgi:hypothetical protein
MHHLVVRLGIELNEIVHPIDANHSLLVCLTWGKGGSPDADYVDAMPRGISARRNLPISRPSPA